jgi:hypothetical protein
MKTVMSNKQMKISEIRFLDSIIEMLLVRGGGGGGGEKKFGRAQIMSSINI